jgi:hypothetical protein
VDVCSPIYKFGGKVKHGEENAYACEAHVLSKRMLLSLSFRHRKIVRLSDSRSIRLPPDAQLSMVSVRVALERTSSQYRYSPFMYLVLDACAHLASCRCV